MTHETESYKKLDGLIRVGIKTVINLTEEHERNQNRVKLFDYASYLTSVIIAFRYTR